MQVKGTFGVALQTDIESTATIIHYFDAPAGINAKLFLRDGEFILPSNSVISKPTETSKDWSDDGKFNSRQIIFKD